MSLYSSKGKAGTESKIDTCLIQAQTSGKPIWRPIQTDGKEMGRDGTPEGQGEAAQRLKALGLLAKVPSIGEPK